MGKRKSEGPGDDSVGENPPGKRAKEIDSNSTTAEEKVADNQKASDSVAEAAPLANESEAVKKEETADEDDKKKSRQPRKRKKQIYKNLVQQVRTVCTRGFRVLNL